MENKVMEDEEEFSLIHTVKEHGFDDIAEKLKRVMDKRDVQIDDIHEEMAQCRSSLADQIESLTICVNTNTRQVTDLHVALNEHMEHEEAHYKKYFQAFPDNDARGHHDAHIKMMAKEQAKAEIKKKLLTHVFTVIATGAVLMLGASIFNYVAGYINKVPHSHGVNDATN